MVFLICVMAVGLSIVEVILNQKHGDGLLEGHLEVTVVVIVGIDGDGRADNRHEVAAFVIYRSSARTLAVVGGDFKDVFSVAGAGYELADAVAHHSVGEMEIVLAGVGETEHLGAWGDDVADRCGRELVAAGVHFYYGHIIDGVYSEDGGHGIYAPLGVHDKTHHVALLLIVESGVDDDVGDHMVVGGADAVGGQRDSRCGRVGGVDSELGMEVHLSEDERAFHRLLIELFGGKLLLARRGERGAGGHAGVGNGCEKIAAHRVDVVAWMGLHIVAQLGRGPLEHTGIIVEILVAVGRGHLKGDSDGNHREEEFCSKSEHDWS